MSKEDPIVTQHGIQITIRGRSPVNQRGAVDIVDRIEHVLTSVVRGEEQEPRSTR